MASKPKLKPCPFCGGRATLKVAFRYMYAVWCTKCDIGTIWRVRGGRNYAKENRQWAIDNWNRRVVRSSGDRAAMREALEYLCSISDLDLSELEVLGKRLEDTSTYGGGLVLKLVHGVRNGQKALAKPPRNCDVPHKDGHEL